MGVSGAGGCGVFSSPAGAFIAYCRDQGNRTMIPLFRVRRGWLRIGLTGCFALTGGCFLALLIWGRPAATWLVGGALAGAIGANLCSLLDSYLGHRTTCLEERKAEEAVEALGSYAERVIALLATSHLSDVTWAEASAQWERQVEWPRHASNATVAAAFVTACERLLRATDPRRSPLEFAEEGQRELLHDATSIVLLRLEIQARGLLLPERVLTGSRKEIVGPPS